MSYSIVARRSLGLVDVSDGGNTDGSSGGNPTPTCPDGMQTMPDPWEPQSSSWNYPKECYLTSSGTSDEWSAGKAPTVQPTPVATPAAPAVPIPLSPQQASTSPKVVTSPAPQAQSASAQSDVTPQAAPAASTPTWLFVGAGAAVLLITVALVR